MTNVMYGIDLPPFQGLSLGAPRYPGRRVALPWAEFFCPFGARVRLGQERTRFWSDIVAVIFSQLSQIKKRKER